MKKIFWLTGSSFFDSDENIVPILNRNNDIFWFVLRQDKSFYSKDYIENHFHKTNVKGKVVDWPRLRSLKSLYFYFLLAKEIKAGKYDIIYIDFLGLPYMFPLFCLMGLCKDNLIYACHDFVDHVNINNRTFISRYKSFIFNHVKNIQLFSKTQLKLYRENYKNSTFYAPLFLKGFGEPTIKKNKNEKVVFLFFGKIQNRKGLEYLISAGNILYKKYPNNFVIKICGGCNDWDYYKKNIQNESCFEIDIRRIENDEIPNLFTTADYLILPYKDVTQSGPLLISYYYNLPVIASNHDGFKEYIENGKTGYIFENKNANDLARVLEQAILDRDKYSDMKKHLYSYIQNNITLDIITQKYQAFFDSIAIK